jgi:hypothetical protein
MHTDITSANATSDLFFVTQSDPLELADRKRRQREISTEANLVKWRVWLIYNLDAALALSDLEFGQAAVIAWCFPTGKHSRANRDAAAIPRLAMRTAVQGEPALQVAMLKSFDRFVALLGLVESDGALRWREGPMVWSLGPKVDRRVYRALHSLHSAGMTVPAQMLMAFLEHELGGDADRLGALSWYRHQVAS